MVFGYNEKGESGSRRLSGDQGPHEDSGREKAEMKYRKKKSRQLRARLFSRGALAVALSFLASCAEVSDRTRQVCALPDRPEIAGLESGGKGRVFFPDPIGSSGNSALLPESVGLDSYSVEVDLLRLNGTGVLSGRYVDVLGWTGCGPEYRAFSEAQRFFYSHSEPEFQEVSAYHAGDRYLAELDAHGVAVGSSAVSILAHCAQEDNAYYQRLSSSDGTVTGQVCLGDSVTTPGAYYADDAAVVVHEIQHGSTGNAYSLTQDFNQFWFDEAGALNEALSDFMALGHLAPVTAQALDPRFFSRWALGLFSPYSYVRGAHRCPEYDADFPNCGGYALGAAGVAPASRRLSYSYPDGLGWPYARNYDGAGVLRTVFLSFVSREQIHNVSTVATGALWDALEALRPLHGGDRGAAYTAMIPLVHEALKALPKPSAAALWSPVTFRRYAQGLVDAAELLGWEAAKKQALAQALTERGLLGGEELQAGWAAVGPGALVGGQIAAPGLRIQDDPEILKAWLEDAGVDPAIVTQGSESVNGRLDPGETVAVWVDIENLSPVTAGGVNIKLESLTQDVSLLRYPYNLGAVSSSKAQIQYSKIHGTAIVAALTAGESLAVPTGNTYFKTNPHYHRTRNTAVWMRVASQLTGSGTPTLRAEVIPSNGASDTVDFSLVLE
jgi:hypothetical protein